MVGAHLRHWLDSLELQDNKCPLDFIVEFKYGVKLAKQVEAQTRLEFIVKLEKAAKNSYYITKPKGPAWKSFGEIGARFHDGFLYGKLDDSTNEMTGKATGHFWSPWLNGQKWPKNPIK